MQDGYLHNNHLHTTIRDSGAYGNRRHDCNLNIIIVTRVHYIYMVDWIVIGGLIVIAVILVKNINDI